MARPDVFGSGLLLAAEDHHDAALRIEFHNDVRTFVRDPNVVFGIYFDRVRVGPSVEVVSDLAHEITALVELQKLRGGGAVGRTCGIAAREDEDVAVGINGDAGDFAEVHVGRELQEIGNGVIGN